MKIGANIGVVAIGRNEGERLRACLASARRDCGSVVYVDSGSTDGSVALARSLGAQVVELDPSVPFTAARARNEGFARLVQADESLEFVQFVDGDCELVEGWMGRGAAELVANSPAAVVCGRRRERHPDRSTYNRLCDIEWDTPVGNVQACGGDAMVRVRAFGEVGGFDPTVIAGEEPEMCVRLRARGWEIHRIDAEMTRHDADMAKFSQWWKRSLRAGYAFALGAALHGRGPTRHWVRQQRSIWFWGLLLPLLSLGLAWPTRGLSLLLWLLYPLLALRIVRGRRRIGASGADAWLWARYCILAKFPQALGQVRCTLHRLRGRPSALIEYRNAPLPAVSSTRP